jgi:hypothetical protein
MLVEVVNMTTTGKGFYPLPEPSGGATKANQELIKDGNTGTFVDATDSEHAIAVAIAAVSAAIVSIPTTPFLAANGARILCTLDLWSAYQPQAQLPAIAADVALPSITIANISAGATVVKALMFLKFRNVENTNAAVNSVSGAQNIQAQKAVAGAYITGIALAGGEMSVPASTREFGDVIMGTTDISAQVPANGAVMNFKWTSALAAHANLNFNDVQIGLRIWFSL